jgi:large subunit ribosomal protein L9
MQIILLERIEKLGQMGDLVNVKPGYARNYLLPQGKALRANDANMERFESERVQREADNLTKRSEAEAEAKKMAGLAVSLVRAASEMGQLFGSVTSRDIAEAVTESGFTINRNQVVMDRAIKTLGLTEIKVRMHPEVSVSITVNIARSLAEAETQLKTGVAVTGETKDKADADEQVTSQSEQITSQSEQVESVTTLADGDEPADDAETTNNATDE